MMGWLILLLLAGATVGGLLLLARPDRAVAQLLLAAVMVAGAGYAWQGSPSLPGRPTPPHPDRGGGDTGFSVERGRFLERLGPDAQQLDAADALIRHGDGAYAVGLLRSAVARRPDSADLWLGLANALTVHADGAITPAARYCFAQAQRLAPTSPAPRYFLGYAYAEAGDLDHAEENWAALLASADGAKWRPIVEEKLRRLAMLKRLIAASPSPSP